MAAVIAWNCGAKEQTGSNISDIILLELLLGALVDVEGVPTYTP